jgi:uncharacterized protein YkwD
MPRFSRVIGAALAAAAFAVLAQVGGGVHHVEALSNCTVSDMSFDSEEQAFLSLINNYRAQNGVPALTVSTNLNRSASWLAQDMATKAYFSHTDSAGRSVGTRVANCDGKGANGENIAAGTVKDTAAEAFEMWRNSAGHNANMLNASYKQIGIARYYAASSPYTWYWVTDFSTSTDGSSSSGGSSGGSTGGSTAGSSGGSTTAPPPAQTIAKAQMTSPTPGSQFTSTSVTFRWSAATGAQGYFLYIGTAPGSNNMLGYSAGNNTSVTVSGFPRTGQTVYVRLWTLTNSGWQYNDYTYRLPR